MTVVSDQLQYLTTTERRALADFVTRLRAMYQDKVLDVRLFGSKARGDSDAESDMDLLIIVAGDEARFRRAITRLGSAIDLEYGVVLSELTMSQTRFAWHRRHRAPLYRNLARESVSLWLADAERFVQRMETYLSATGALAASEDEGDAE